MTRSNWGRCLALACVVLAVQRAVADPEADADRAFRDAQQRAAAGDVTAIDAFEALGTAPATRWTDDAWAEVARIAERTGDFARARSAHERVIAIGTDDVLVRRARAALARLAIGTGDGKWDAVVREHERLVADIYDGDDPHDALEALEQLVRKNTHYSRAANVWLALAQAWEQEGEGDHAIALLQEALSGGRSKQDATVLARLRVALVRVAIRQGELAIAERELDELASWGDRVVAAELRGKLEIAQRRAWIRRALWIAIGLALAGCVIMLRRAAGSWRGAGRALARPPVEAVFLLPVGGVLVAVAQTGNPLVARALLGITIAGIAVAWISGVLLELQRPKRAVHWIAHAVLALGVVASAAYLAIDRDRMLDLVEETLEHGPIPR